MRNVDNAGTGRFETPHDCKKPLDFSIGKCCSRLVHHDNPRRHCQCFRDFDELPLTNRKPRDRNVEGQFYAEFVQDARRALAKRACVDKTGARWFCTETDVCGDGQLWHERELLVDHPDAEARSLLRRIDPRADAVNVDLALVGYKRARQNSHQRRLAGAILPNEDEDFSGSQG